jgi:diguanylate cyclase (GGDEF)-like protein/PAS domain S-box-containing protein
VRGDEQARDGLAHPGVGARVQQVFQRGGLQQLAELLTAGAQISGQHAVQVGGTESTTQSTEGLGHFFVGRAGDAGSHRLASGVPKIKILAACRGLESGASGSGGAMETMRPHRLAAGSLLLASPGCALAAEGLPGGWGVLALVLAAMAATAAAAGWWCGGRRTRAVADVGSMIDADSELLLALCGSGDGFWTWDPGCDELVWSVPEADSPRRVRHRLRGRRWLSERVHPEDRDRLQAALAAHRAGTAPEYACEYRVRASASPLHWTWIRARGRIVRRDDVGQPMLLAGTFHEATRERAEESERRISAAVIDHMLEGVVITDLEFNFVAANPAFERLTGYAETELKGLSAKVLDSTHHDASFYAEVRGRIATDGHWSGEMWQRRRSGDDFLAWLQIAAVYGPDGAHGHYVAVMSDITDRKRAEQRLRFLAHYDPLTSLPNRSLLRQRLRQRIERGGSRRLALMFLDLDRFKHVNDSLGHAAGDELLRQAARRLRHAVGDAESLARFGGDEFTVMVAGDASNEAVENLAGEILDAFAGPLAVAGQEIAISPSIGIAYYPDHARDAEELLRHADAAMYEAKARGRNTWRVYSARLAEDASERTRLETSLRKALDRDEIRLVYQPKLSLRSGRITGVEALMRWRSAELGHVPPTRFIPLAEETGLIVPLGEWALRRAVSQAKSWKDAGLGDLRIAVNVSAVQLSRGGYPELVALVLDGLGVPPSWLEIELTESALMADPKRAGQTVNELREIGVRVSIDDFGTGYSSLGHLRGLAIDTVKIDKSFVEGIEHNVDDEVLTSTIVLMAHSLGLSVVAEGVETERQLAFLRSENCDEVQGYWLSRPLDARACTEFLRDYRMPKGLVLPGAG